MRRFLMTIAILLASVLSASAAEFKVVELNGTDIRWKLRPAVEGEWARYKIRVGEVEERITAVGEEEITVASKRFRDGVAGSPREMTFKRKSDAAFYDKVKEHAPHETVEINGQKIDCYVVALADADATFWFSPDVPLAVVKMVHNGETVQELAQWGSSAQ